MATQRKEPFVSHYDPSLFYSPISNKTPDKVGMPVHNLVKYPIKFTVTLKDIGLEGLDSPNCKKSFKRKKHDIKKQKSSDINIEQLPVEPPFSPRIRRLIAESVIHEPIYEGTFYKNKISNSNESNTCNDQKPIDPAPETHNYRRSILDSSQRRSPRVNTFQERSISVPAGDTPFEEQIRRDNKNRFVDINNAPVPVPEGDIPFEEQIRRDNEDRFVNLD